MSRKGLSPYLTEVNRIARILIAEWGRVEPKHDVTLHPTSYNATFADMARKVVDDNIVRGLHPPDHRPMATRVEDALRAKPQRISNLLTLLSIDHSIAIRRQVEDIIWDMLKSDKVYMDPESVMHWKAP